MALSRLRAATSFLRFPFSSRGCFGCPTRSVQMRVLPLTSVGGLLRDSHRCLLTSTDNTRSSVCFRTPTINSAGRHFLHDKSPFISDWIRRKLTLNMHQKRGCPSLLNVTVPFIKEGRKQESYLGDRFRSAGPPAIVRLEMERSSSMQNCPHP
jgi:hypothetical protein